MRSVALGSALVGGALAACTLVGDADRVQCNVDADCTNHGIGPDAKCVARACAVAPPAPDASVAEIAPVPVDPIWGCTGAAYSPAVEEPNVPFTIRPEFFGPFDQAPIAGVGVKACAETDDACKSPLPDTIATSDERGAVETPLYAGFRGYLDFTPPAGPGIPPLPTIAYFLAVDKNRPTVNPFRPMPLYSKPIIEIIVSENSRPLRSDLGIVLYTVFDCANQFASDVQVRVDPITADTFSFYTDDIGTPSITQQQTSSEGTGGFINLPPGRVTLTAARASGGPVATIEVVIRSGTVTDVLFDPHR